VTLLLALLLLAGCAELLPQPTSYPAANAHGGGSRAGCCATDTPQPTATLPATATVRPTATTRPTNTPEPPTPTPIRPTSYRYLHTSPGYGSRGHHRRASGGRNR
jgi:hypothetical protein